MQDDFEGPEEAELDEGDFPVRDDEDDLVADDDDDAPWRD
jgi:hypothetical protein